MYLLIAFMSVITPMSFSPEAEVADYSVSQGELTLSLNINGGKKLLLSDHSLYEIAPDDVNISSAWLSPVTIEVSSSGDPNYPEKLTNVDSGSSVRAKLLKSS
jgi:hypothetical protein